MIMIVLFFALLCGGIACGQDAPVHSDLQALLEIEADMDAAGCLGWKEGLDDGFPEEDGRKYVEQLYLGVRWSKSLPHRVVDLDVSNTCGRTCALSGWSTGFASLTMLEELDLEKNKVTGAEGLSQLERLTILILRDNLITSTDGIRDLPALRLLDVSGNPITGNVRFTGLDNLERLLLTAHLDDLIGLKDLNKLERLALINCRIGDMSALGDLPELQRLGLFGCQLDDSASLEKLHNMNTLSIINASPKGRDDEMVLSPPFLAKTNLSELRELNQLAILTIRHNGLTDISGLRGLRLYLLDLNNNDIDDLTPLEEMDSLRELRLEQNNISDIRALGGLSNLGECILSGNRISDLTPLRELTGLYSIILNGNQISDISPLQGLENFRKGMLSGLDVGNNRLPLSQLYLVKHTENLHLGEQREVKLPSLPSELHTNAPYDLTAEHMFDGHETHFLLLNRDGSPVKESDYEASNGYITFFRPGDYIMQMENAALRSQGTYPGNIFFLEVFDEKWFRSTRDWRSILAQPIVENFYDSQNRYGISRPTAKVFTGVLTVREP